MAKIICNIGESIKIEVPSEYSEERCRKISDEMISRFEKMRTDVGPNLSESKVLSYVCLAALDELLFASESLDKILNKFEPTNNGN